MAKPFKGKIELDIRDSTPDWEAFLPGQGARGRAQRARRALRRHRAGRLVAVRRADRDADAQRLADRGLTYSSGTRRRCARRRARVPDRSKPSPERLRHDLRGVDGLSWLRSHIPPENGTMPPCCAMPAGARSGSARTTTCRSTPGRWARPRRSGRSAGLRPLLRLHRRRDQPVVSRPRRGQPLHRAPYGPEDGYHLSKDLADQALKMIRDRSSPSRTSPGTCGSALAQPCAAPRAAGVHRPLQGQFDDGYEAYREWVLPRMIARGILPEGTELTPINPMTPGTFSAGDSVRPWDTPLGRREAAVLAHGRGLRRLLRVHRCPGRADRRLPGGVGPTRQHDRLLLRRQRRLRRGQPNGSVNEGKFFNRGRTDGGQSTADRQARLSRRPTTTIPTGWAAAFSTPSGCSSAIRTRAA